LNNIFAKYTFQLAFHLQRSVSKLNLDQLLKGLQARDHQTLKAIYKDFYPKVLGYIISKGGGSEDAKDIFQESIMVIYKLLEKDELDIQQDFGSYVIGIAKRIWLKQIRSKNIHERFVQSSSGDEVEDHPSDIELENEVELDLIRKHILKLGDDCRNILMWSAEGKTNDEIAVLMKYKSEKTVRTKKYKCKTALIELIKKDPKFKTR
jgi:RNA polymerase sigma factor (sigma-70 family)